MIFKLKKYFLLTSLPVVAVIIALSAYGYIYFSTGIMVEQETHYSQHKTHLLGQMLWPRFQSHIIWSKGQNTESLRAAQAVVDMDEIVLNLFRGTDTIKVKLYNLDGLTVYSSQHSQIGVDKSSNPGFVSARRGKVLSNLTWRNDFHAFEEIIMERDVVSSYLPLYDTRTREVIAVVELYSDVTVLIDRIYQTRNQVILSAFVCFALLLGVLYKLMQRADLIIHSQHENLTDANEEISRLAYLDAVTRLPNRHRFDQSLEKLIQHSRRSGEGFALLYLDLDGFKAINDSHGHGAGDAVLIEVSKQLKRTIRGTDSVYRVGGDEFAVLLPGANMLEDAARVAENLLISARQPITMGENTHIVSVSIGIACYPKSASTSLELIKLADSAMYKAKDRGKNCCETA